MTIKMLKALAVSSALFPSLALAVGMEDPLPPKETQTTVECETGTIWDDEAKECVKPKDASLDDDALYKAVRELAYFDNPETALEVLGVMQEGETDRVLTYLGFAHRKLGDMTAAYSYYDKALEQNPDNLMARSYLGQAYVSEGLFDLATAELSEIRARGGRGTWPEVALRLAIDTGSGKAY